MNIPVDICCIHPDAIIPKYQTPGSCAFDIHTIDQKVIEPGEIVRLRTGLVFKVPKGHTMIAAARSSLPKKHGLSVPQGIGIIDQDFCGPEDELLIQLHNFSNESVKIQKGDRLIQCMIVPIAVADFNEINAVNGQSRGGYGSTG